MQFKLLLICLAWNVKYICTHIPFLRFRHENTYRNMSDLNHDENYRMGWKSSLGSFTKDCEDSTLIDQGLRLLGPTSNNSDSGHSSGVDSMSPHSHHRSQSDPQATCSSAIPYSSPTSSKRGFISSYLEEHKKRRSCAAPPAVADGVLEAPKEFRTTTNSRHPSITESIHSTYAVSNTSDYGSNIVPSDTNYHNNKIRHMAESLLPIENDSSELSLDHTKPDQSEEVITISSNGAQISADSLTESANRKPFSTFHGDAV